MRRLLMAGRSRYALPLSSSLARKFEALSGELDVHVLGSEAPGGGEDPRFRLVPQARPKALDGALFYALFPMRLARELRRLHPDVVLVQGAHEGSLALLARRLGRVSTRVVVDIHGDPAAATRLYGSSWRRLLARPGDALARRAIRHADGVRTISAYTSGLVRSLGVEPTAEFPAFMDLDPFLSPTPGPPPQRPVALFVGVLERYKAVDVLARAWPRVAATVPGAELHVVGRGTLADVVERLVADSGGSVRWSPVLTTTEVAAAMDGATVLVLPSRSEGLGRVVIEAFCRARAVVASRVGGIQDLVTDGGNGLLVPPESPEALAAAVSRVLSDRELAERLGAEGRRSVEPWLASPEEYASSTRQLVDRVLDR